MFERYYRELLGFLSRLVADRATAADMTQEAYVRAYAASRAGARIGNPRALLYRIARNLVIDQHRRDTAAGLAGEARGGDEVDPDDFPAAGSTEPERACAAREHFEALARVVEALPPRCREVFVLVKFDGLSHAETARRLGIAVKTVEMQVQIALDACWDELGALDALPPGIRPRRTGGGRRP